MRVCDGEGVRASVVACVCLLVCIESICMNDCVILHFILAIGLFENIDGALRTSLTLLQSEGGTKSLRLADNIDLIAGYKDILRPD